MYDRIKTIGLYIEGGEAGSKICLCLCKTECIWLLPVCLQP